MTLRHRVFSGLHLGLLKPGDRLPSVRDVARELSVDPRVILSAYRELEKEGLVDLRQRSGIYVAPAGQTADRSLRRKADWMVEVLVEGLARNIPAPEFPERIRRCLTTVRLRAACLECNADQLASLAGELRGDYGLEAAGVEVATLASDHLPTPLREADLLVTTPFHALEIQTLAARLKKPWIAVSLRPELFAEIGSRLQVGTAYIVVADPRFAVKVPRLFASTPGAGHLRPLVAGRDDLEDIPGDAPTYITRLAREELGDTPLTRRVMPVPRVFSSDTARRVFSFVVRANLAALDDGG